jgi:serine/threonine protein kinase
LKQRLRSLLKISDAVQYMHTHRLIHWDLMPANLGFDRNGVLKSLTLMTRRTKVQQYGQAFLFTKRMLDHPATWVQNMGGGDVPHSSAIAWQMDQVIDPIVSTVTKTLGRPIFELLHLPTTCKWAQSS